VEITFWFSIAVLFYCYIGYGLLLFIRNRVKNTFASFERTNTFELPPVTLVVAAYNEEAILPQKIKNCAEIDYPPHLFNLIFVTDGSTDYSKDLIRQHDFYYTPAPARKKWKVGCFKKGDAVCKDPYRCF
jgi:cellulose synthase/poly-beta-1,6-N-acetylglucosamine synthase-like glycosyltransferase